MRILSRITGVHLLCCSCWMMTRFLIISTNVPVEFSNSRLNHIPLPYIYIYIVVVRRKQPSYCPGYTRIYVILSIEDSMHIVCNIWKDADTIANKESAERKTHINAWREKKNDDIIILKCECVGQMQKWLCSL